MHDERALMSSIPHRRGPNCASGDSWRAKLCIWRQLAGQTVHLASAVTPDCAPGDRETHKTAPGCRRMHSLAVKLSPEAQFEPLGHDGAVFENGIPFAGMARDAGRPA
jgi:hypothetical protein